MTVRRNDCNDGLKKKKNNGKKNNNKWNCLHFRNDIFAVTFSCRARSLCRRSKLKSAKLSTSVQLLPIRCQMTGLNCFMPLNDHLTF